MISIRQNKLVILLYNFFFYIYIYTVGLKREDKGDNIASIVNLCDFNVRQSGECCPSTSAIESKANEK